MSSFHCHLGQYPLQGRIENQHAPGLPILMIQGGPGMPYDYLLPIADLLKNNPVIFYNPAAYAATSATIPVELLTFAHFQEEIEQIRRHLRLDKFLMVSHSAGTIIALDYVLHHPSACEGTIYISPVFNVPYYQKRMQELLTTFPENARAIITQAMAGQEVDPIDRMEAMAHFAERHICRLPQWPEALIHASMATNRIMQNYLWGPNDFVIQGIWKNFDRLQPLQQTSLPTLLVSGEHDFIDYKSCQFYGESCSHAQIATIQGASHNPHLESPDNLQCALNTFIMKGITGF